ncbi:MULTISPECIES: GrrA/OscA1 family cyclophane-containing rSAM-modified RiPP [unclassified Cyanobium]|uniref:GrrA/OscA1 family cyclophane-containing rSAM-modified RiPP n=1 Tax=unclassified Cyanobium TaxID=2627006 RepID=UPI0020CEDB1B|nr:MULTISPECIES: GrrA/OscA1 family cyclophane-containing rSAM-modified RiPP [unclassified Cyanobium]MCP9833907.1 rSAM-associated Gly-rich repeat protein [Cyanobium sp. La Preciosa 7G6]MCP9936671.1 rSAM-associated Gly-rich repeat protein [Cyanobium sp. Aljojuca 7A6]
MTHHPRSGLFGFLLLLAALAPAGALAQASSPMEAAPGSIDARLRRISQAMGQESPGPEAAEGQAKAADGRLAYIFVNGGGPRFGWGNGGFRNGGWGNGGFRNGGWGNGGFRNGGWGNGGFRNGGFRNFW